LWSVATADAFQPDLWLWKNGGRNLIGSDIHNTTGWGQTTGWQLPPGGKVTYKLWLENDGGRKDALLWTGTGSDANFTITYFDQSGAGNNVTSEVAGAGLLTRPLPPGISKVVHFVIEASPGAPAGAEQTFRIGLASNHEPAIQDVLRVRVKVKESAGALQVAGLTGVPTAAGAQIAFALSTPAQVSARVLNQAGRPVATLGAPRLCGAGPNTLVWSARADTGLPAPNGAYLVEVIARTPEGAEARAVAPLTLLR
jgi:hypothetical protein